MILVRTPKAVLRNCSLFAASLISGVVPAGIFAADAPKSSDDRIMMELFAEHPQIVTPTGIDVDSRGRVFVAESHTHFRPDDYDGPEKDRILIFEDTDGDGNADRKTVFHEGYTHIMDIEFNRDGWLYVATRMDIHRMRDTNGDNRADKIQPVVSMQTTGTYPHNGLSGLAFDFAGDLNFGLGENLGHKYTLIGTDGKRISGGGEGGSTYHALADGAGLRRVSTGWWNPHGMCVDAFGRVFGTDNDPGASPPCRLIQVVEGGDYGYEYRYGRTGLHPLITWTGDIPGTLPMIAGTGEAPCAIVAYESDALPREYLGDLIVASWADHRIEHYRIQQKAQSGLVSTKRQLLFQGGNEFRPVGLSIAADGTVYVTDWVSSSYSLHKKGRIWRIRPKNFQPVQRPALPAEAVKSYDRNTRETAARKLAQSDSGRDTLARLVKTSDVPQVRAAALLALGSKGDFDFSQVAKEDKEIAIRVLAVRRLLRDSADPAVWAAGNLSWTVRAEAVYELDSSKHKTALANALADKDPYLFHAAVSALSHNLLGGDSNAIREFTIKFPVAALLAAKRNPETRKRFAASGLAKFLKHPNSDARFIAVKWIADDQLTRYRTDVKAMLSDPTLDYRLLLAASAALDRLDGKTPSDRPSSALLLQKINDQRVPPAIRALCLRLIDPKNPSLKPTLFKQLLESEDAQLRLEAVRTLAEHLPASELNPLEVIAGDSSADPQVRAAAIAGLAADPQRHLEFLLEATEQETGTLRDEALRSLVGATLSENEKSRLSELAKDNPAVREGVRRLTNGMPAERPSAADTDAWLKLVSDPGNAESGERIFFGLRVGTCSKCHEHHGRGNAVGPPLTQISERLETQGDNGLRWLLETILQPSREMAPQYTPWLIVTTDGKTLTGLPRRKGGNAEAYLGLDGNEFVVRKPDIESHRESAKSIMPDGLLQSMTTRELRDLFAFLQDSKD